MLPFQVLKRMTDGIGTITCETTARALNMSTLASPLNILVFSFCLKYICFHFRCLGNFWWHTASSSLPCVGAVIPVCHSLNAFLLALFCRTAHFLPYRQSCLSSYPCFLFCFVLFCFVLFCFVLFCFVFVLQTRSAYYCYTVYC